MSSNADCDYKVVTEAEEKYKTVFLSLNVMAIIHDIEGNIVEANNNALETLEYSKNKLLSLNVADLHPPEALEFSQRLIIETVSQGSAEGETALKKINKDRFPAYVFMSLLDIGGKKLIQCILHDITEHKKIETEIDNGKQAEALKQSEEALRKSEEHFRLLVETTNVIPWEFNPITNKFTYVGPQAEELLGYPINNWYKEDFWPSLIHKEDRDQVLNTCKLATEALNDHVLEYRMISQKGEIIWIYEMVSVVSENGEPITLRGFMIDITERKQADFLLLSEKHILELISQGKPLPKILDHICFAVEKLTNKMLCSFCLVDHTGKALVSCAAPNMSPDYAKDIGQLPIGPDTASCGTAAYTKKQVIVSDTSTDPLWANFRDLALNHNLQACWSTPILSINGELHGTFAMYYSEPRTPKQYEIEVIERAAHLARIAIERTKSEEKLKTAFSEIEKLKNQLERENIYLQEEVQLHHDQGEMVSDSKVMQSVISLAGQVANTDSTVLLLGETGTGKELLAKSIHNMSPRKDRAIVMVNCATLQPNLIESELFGHEKGAFTGAMTKRIGYFEIADGSTIFLDEVGELPLELQSKLLRVLQEGCFERLGSGKTIEVDVRVLAATNQNLSEAVQKGIFREDLFYRLNVFPISIPPLRERREDIPLLINRLVEEFAKEMGKNIKNISKKTIEASMSYKWPGNIRELRNEIERAMILSSGSTLQLDLPNVKNASRDQSTNLEQVEKNHIRQILDRTGWRVRGSGGAAELLGLKPNTLDSKMKKLGIRREHSKH